MKLIMLGSGTSYGVPRVGEVPGGDWGRCDPAEPAPCRYAQADPGEPIALEPSDRGLHGRV